MAELTKQQLQTLQFNSEVATALAVSEFVNASTTELSTSLIARIQALEGFSTFIGVKDALPESAENGQIVIVGEKEYIWGPKADGVAGWTELGDTTAEATSITELSSAVADLATTKADVSAVNASVEALTKAIDDVEASLSGYDTVGSADAALTSAKAYTDEQIAAVEGEISSLADVVETKADQTAVDAAISAINENISTLSAKAEEDPVFTAWKDDINVIAGSGTTINIETAYGGVGIGSNCTTTESGVAIGARATAEMNGGIAIGESANSLYNDAIAIGTNATAENNYCVQIGEGVNINDYSFQFRSTQIVNSNGKITTANLAGMSDLQDALNNVAEVTASDDIATLRATVNALAAAIKAFAGL